MTDRRQFDDACGTPRRRRLCARPPAGVLRRSVDPSPTSECSRAGALRPRSRSAGGPNAGASDEASTRASVRSWHARPLRMAMTSGPSRDAGAAVIARLWRASCGSSSIARLGSDSVVSTSCRAEEADRAHDTPRTAGSMVAASAVSGRVQPLLRQFGGDVCADSGDLVDRGVIVTSCPRSPECCCADLPTRVQEEHGASQRRMRGRRQPDLVTGLDGLLLGMWPRTIVPMAVMLSRW